MIVIGVDPGASGGLVALGPGGEYKVTPMPETEADLLRWIRSRNDWGAAAGGIVAYVEKIPTAIFGVGKTSMSVLYGNYMQCRAFLYAVGISYELVPPTTWQAALGLPKKQGRDKTWWKNLLKSKAQQLFPRTKITLDTADAFLIAEYGRRHTEGRV